MSWDHVLDDPPSAVVHDRLRVTDDGWTLVETGHDTDPESDRAVAVGSNFLVGNGYLGYRGTTPELRAEHDVALVVSDTYDCADGRWSELCTVPNPLFVEVAAGDRVVLATDPDAAVATALDLRRAEFASCVAVEVDGSELAIRTQRIASATRLHVLAQRCTVTAGPARAVDRPAAPGPVGIDVVAGIDPEVWSLNGDHFRTVRLDEVDGVFVAVATTVERGVDIAVACDVRVETDHRDADPSSSSTIEGQTIDGEITADGRVRGRSTSAVVDPGRSVIVETIAAVCSSNDVDDPLAAVLAEVRAARSQVGDGAAGAGNGDEPGGRGSDSAFARLRIEHRRWWDDHWRRVDVAIEGPVVDQVGVRFGAYHNRISTPAHTDHLPIGARGLSCQAYQGAAFWDQEVFNLPAYLFTEPDVARRLLVYRHRTLDGARRKASRLGYAGAFFAWISGDTGDELCPDVFFADVLTGRPIRNHFNDWQMHVAPDVVTTMARYVEVTGDEAFLVEHGAEIAFEVARFLHSFVRLDPRRGTYHCIRLLGPDEWHENVDDNAFTNHQVRAALDVAARTHRWMADHHSAALARLASELSLDDDEVAGWADVAERLHLPRPDPDTGVVEQFVGFHGLEDITPDELRERLLHPQEYWGWPNGIAVATKVSKQADVVMLMWLHESEFSAETRAANYDHYEPFCAHGSTLSASAHAMVASRLGRTGEALAHYRRTALVDLANAAHAVVGGTFIGGIHTAACAGTYQVVTQGFGGLGFADGRLTIDPALPDDWSSIEYPISWRGAELRTRIELDRVSVTSAESSPGPVTVRIAGADHEVAPGSSIEVALVTS